LLSARKILVKLAHAQNDRAGNVDLQDSTGCLHFGSFPCWCGTLLALFAAPSWFWLMQVFFFQTAPAWLIVGNALLWPMKSRQTGFIEAINLGQVDPFVIGITGSYGKTSTKAILGTILECLEPTFWPPEVSTPMGITINQTTNRNIILLSLKWLLMDGIDSAAL